MSGRSDPHVFMASSHGTCGTSPRSTSATSLKSAVANSVMIANTSSRVTKLISRSICVNSACRSARGSSSRRQRQICMYRSQPDTMRICLKICGLCGSAYQYPAWWREGTMKSRAPSGVGEMSSGVSTSMKSWSPKNVRVTCVTLCRSASISCILGLRKSMYRCLSRCSSAIFSAS